MLSILHLPSGIHTPTSPETPFGARARWTRPLPPLKPSLVDECSPPRTRAGAELACTPVQPGEHETLLLERHTPYFRRHGGGGILHKPKSKRVGKKTRH